MRFNSAALSLPFEPSFFLSPLLAHPCPPHRPARHAQIRRFVKTTSEVSHETLIEAALPKLRTSLGL
jgi:hypothetical protein